MPARSCYIVMILIKQLLEFGLLYVILKNTCYIIILSNHFISIPQKYLILFYFTCILTYTSCELMNHFKHYRVVENSFYHTSHFRIFISPNKGMHYELYQSEKILTSQILRTGKFPL